MALDIWDTVYATLTPNTDPIDALVSYGNYRALIYFSSHNANSWKNATTASLTVPANKKLVILQVITSPFETDGSRDSRLFNTTDATEVLRKNGTPAFPSGVFDWTGDLATASQFQEVAAGKTVRLEIWNTDTNKRSGGMVVIARLDNASGGGAVSGVFGKRIIKSGSRLLF